MFSLRRALLVNALKLFDLAVMVFAFTLVTLPVFGESHTMSFAQFFSIQVKVGSIVIFLSLLFLWHTLFSSFSLYESRRLSSRATELGDVLKATSLGTLCLWVAALVLHI